MLKIPIVTKVLSESDLFAHLLAIYSPQIMRHFVWENEDI